MLPPPHQNKIQRSGRIAGNGRHAVIGAVTFALGLRFSPLEFPVHLCKIIQLVESHGRRKAKEVRRYPVDKVGLLNVDGYYKYSLLSFIDKAIEDDFISPNARLMIVSTPTAQELVKKLEIIFLKRNNFPLTWINHVPKNPKADQLNMQKIVLNRDYVPILDQENIVWLVDMVRQENTWEVHTVVLLCAGWLRTWG